VIISNCILWKFQYTDISVERETLDTVIKGIHWQLDKLGLKVVFCLDKNDGESHFAELGSSWPGEAKTWPKIALRVGGRAEKYCVGGRAAGCYWASWSRVQQNDLYHRFRLGQTELLRPTCKIATGSL